MNGMKLGSKERPKNSFGYQNQFNSNDSDSDENDDNQDNSGSYQYDSELSLQPNKNLKKLIVNPQIKLNNQKILHQDINIKQKQAEFMKKEVAKQKQIKQMKQQAKIKEQPKQNKVVIQKQKDKPVQIVKQISPVKDVKQTSEMKQVKIIKQNKSIELPTKPTQIDKKISNLNQGMEKLNVSIQEMKDGYEDLKMEEKLMRNRNLKKEEEIKAYLSKKQIEKQNLNDKKKQQEEKDKQRLQEQLRLEEEAKANKQRQKIQQNLRKLGQQKQKRQFEKLKMMEQKRIASHLFQKIQQEEGDNKKFHLRKMEEDRRKMQQEFDRRKQILAERKQIYKSIDYSELESHQRRHQQLFKELTQARRAKREEIEQQIMQKNNKVEQYRGISHDYVLDEIEERENKKKEPKQKKRKIKQYEQFVRENYLPKTHQPSTRKSDVKINRSSMSHREVKRYRYLNGVAYGEVIENLPKGKSDAEQKQIGNDYLAYLHSLPKKKKSDVLHENTLSPEDLQILDKKLNKIVRVKKQRNPLYEGRHSVEVKISSNPTRDEVSMVINQLKTKDEQARMREKLLRHQNANAQNNSLSHRQINDQIVKNIQQKLNLLAKL